MCSCSSSQLWERGVWLPVQGACISWWCRQWPSDQWVCDVILPLVNNLNRKILQLYPLKNSVCLWIQFWVNPLQFCGILGKPVKMYWMTTLSNISGCLTSDAGRVNRVFLCGPGWSWNSGFKCLTLILSAWLCNFLKKIYLKKLCVFLCVCMKVCVHVSIGVWREARGVQCPTDGVIGTYGLSNVYGGNYNQVLCQINTGS